MNTPKAAKELWCPMIRTLNVDKKELATCIAEKCAMWRWFPSNVFVEGPKLPGSSSPTMIPLPPEVGYCGLAGRPEVCT